MSETFAKKYWKEFEELSLEFIKSQYKDSSAQCVHTSFIKDGGFDAEGRYKIFKNVENSVFVEFYMQAKCYGKKTAVGVTDTARLISRIKNRQFGIMVTTSYIADQAYKEVREDGHPVVFINGKNIIDYIFDELEIRTEKQLLSWLQMNYQ